MRESTASHQSNASVKEKFIVFSEHQEDGTNSEDHAAQASNDPQHEADSVQERYMNDFLNIMVSDELKQ